jgi:hypothetical protein
MNAQTPTVEQILDASDERRQRNIAQRINAVMGEVDYIQKQQPKDQGMKYSYVSHDAVTARVRPLLKEHGVVYYPCNLAVQQNGNRTEAVFTVRFENIDDRADFIDVATFGYGVDNQDKGPGKAISYGVKYALLKVLGLETGDDPEAIQDASADHRASDLITSQQRDKLEALIDKAGVSRGRFCKRFEIEDVALLPSEKFGEAKDALEAKINEPA